MNFASLARLESLSVRGMRLGLEAIDALCERLGRPERSFPSVLVGGTNGKGSTAATLSAIALACGRRTGLYTSPHLIAATERVRVGAEDAPVEALDGALAKAFAAAGRAPEIPLTYFEAITAAAFLLFRDARVELGILEVGLGGRFDATNVAPAALSIVTSIGLDHMAELGPTREAIAREKAGIFRRGRPALVSADDPLALGALGDAAAAAGAELHDAAREISVRRISTGLRGTSFEIATPRMEASLETPLAGAHQAWNAALAIRGAELIPGALGPLSAETAARALSAVRWPGRLERLALPGGRGVLLDGCHNPDGAHALAGFLDDAGLAGLCPLVFGAMADKDVEGIAAPLFPKVSEVVLVAAAPPRGASPEELLRRTAAFARKARTAPDARAALARLAAEPEGPTGAPIIVAGSLYLVGEARAAILAGGTDGEGRP
ncbi:MAG: folylpolyglutamate synthase/dihydrofolate synthase family protein [Acidobacteriota bacterium]